MVEVFKTNVEETGESAKIIARLRDLYPKGRINFDLSDCDRILRIEADQVCITEIINLLASIGYRCEVLL